MLGFLRASVLLSPLGGLLAACFACWKTPPEWGGPTKTADSMALFIAMLAEFIIFNNPVFLYAFWPPAIWALSGGLCLPFVVVVEFPLIVKVVSGTTLLFMLAAIKLCCYEDAAKFISVGLLSCFAFWDAVCSSNLSEKVSGYLPAPPRNGTEWFFDFPLNWLVLKSFRSCNLPRFLVRV